jgi:ADP-L-glycero-D-manno-heptose 6-epimerase
VLEHFIENPLCNGIFNIGSGEPHSFNQLARAMFSALDQEAHIEYFPMPDNIRAQYQYFTQARTEKLRAAGFNAPWSNFEIAVQDYVTQYLAPAKYLGS